MNLQNTFRFITKSKQNENALTPPHPTPPWRFRKSKGRSRLSNGRSRLSNGRFRISNGRSRISHGLAAAPGHGQVALGAKKVAQDPAPQVRDRPRSKSGKGRLARRQKLSLCHFRPNNIFGVFLWTNYENNKPMVGK